MPPCIFGVISQTSPAPVTSILCPRRTLHLKVYPIGIPVAYFCILWRERESLNPLLRDSAKSAQGVQSEATSPERRLPTGRRVSGEEEERGREGGGRGQEYWQEEEQAAGVEDGGSVSDDQEEDEEKEEEEEKARENDEDVDARWSVPELVPSILLWKDYCEF